MPRQPLFKVRKVRTQTIPSFVKNRTFITPEVVPAQMRFTVESVSSRGRGLSVRRGEFILSRGRVVSSRSKTIKIR